MPTCSLIICSKNGGRRLSRCLAHVKNLDGIAAAEVILVDNDSSDDSRSMMEAYRESSTGETKVLIERRHGNSAGRNAAIEVSTSELLIFTDDDCLVMPDFLSEWLNIFSNRIELGYATGRIMPFNLRNSNLGCQTNEREEMIPSNTFFGRGRVQGSNMAFRRKSIDDAGLFDVSFGAGTRYSGEDWDLALRVSFAGWVGGYFPDPTVMHDHNRGSDEAEKRLLFYDCGAGAVYAKHVRTSHRWMSVRKFAGDLWGVRKYPKRLKALIEGYCGFGFSCNLRSYK